MAALTCYPCAGAGGAARGEACPACYGTGLACPVCRNRRWVRVEGGALGAIAPCPACRTPEAWQIAVTAYIQARAGQHE